MKKVLIIGSTAVVSLEHLVKRFSQDASLDIPFEFKPNSLPPPIFRDEQLNSHRSNFQRYRGGRKDGMFK